MRLSSRLQGIFVAASLAVAPAATAVAQGIQLAQQPTYRGEQVEAFRAITAARDAFVETYAKGDIEGIMSAYHPDATFAGTLQPFWLEGADAVRDLWERFFAAWPQRTLIFRQPVVRFYDGTSVETGYMEMYMGGDEKPPVITYIRYSITRALAKDGWKIVNMHVSRLPHGK